MSHIRFQCVNCNAHTVAEVVRLHCAECASPLDVAYTSDTGASQAPEMPSPLHLPGDAIRLGEGNTPSVLMSAACRILGIPALYAKLEMMNPTGSFKDRGTAVMMSVMREAGVSEVVEDSSGNAGASVAAYAARAGIKAHIFAPANAPAAKLGQIKVYGATTHFIKGSRQDTANAAADFAERNGFVYASHNLSPFFTEGTKTFAYETIEQFGNELPAHIVIPVGNGSLLIGAFKGFSELLQNGIIHAIPKLHAIQARAVMPIAAAFSGEPQTQSNAASTTIAGGISVSNPPRLHQAVQTLRATGGSAAAVAEMDIRRWHSLLAHKEGIFVEPTSAAAFAGLEVLTASGIISPTESVLVAATGSGLKDAFPA